MPGDVYSANEYLSEYQSLSPIQACSEGHQSIIHAFVDQLHCLTHWWQICRQTCIVCKKQHV